jgi:hypothetical protein
MKEEKLSIFSQSNLNREHGHWSTENLTMILQTIFSVNYAKPKLDLALKLKTLNGLSFLTIGNIKTILMPLNQI